jgi:hypothetical protein
MVQKISIALQFKLAIGDSPLTRDCLPAEATQTRSDASNFGEDPQGLRRPDL